LSHHGYVPSRFAALKAKRGAELLFQVITKRDERGSIIITTNIAFKDWPRIFAGNARSTPLKIDPPIASLLLQLSYRKILLAAPKQKL